MTLEPITLPETIDASMHPLYLRLEKLQQILTQVYRGSCAIADGDLRFSMEGTDIYCGALKELQSKLICTLWQVEQVCNGDYTQRMEYFGDFSTAFNTMYHALQKKEEIQEKNLILREQLVEHETQLLEMQLQKQLDHYRDMEESYKEIEAYRHDMKNHLICLTSLLEKKDFNDMHAYLMNLGVQFNGVTKNQHNDNFMMYALLDEKIAQAKEMDVQVHITVEIDRDLTIENKDWCILLGNSLDNALEALECVAVKDRYLEIAIISEYQKLAFRMKNTICQKPIRNEHGFQTTKRDKRHHGLGLKNMKRCVETYHGEMNIEVKNDEFIVTFILFHV